MPVQPCGAGLHWQDCVVPVPPQVWCVPQAAWLWIVTHVSGPVTQVVRVFAPPVQNVPAKPPVQAIGAGLHWQTAEPAAPVQVWFVEHVAAVPAT
jgi:hypothetical protein